MRIRRLETFTRGHLSLVRVTADDGLQGWGQMRGFWHCGAIPALVFGRKVAPEALGRPCEDIEALTAAVARAHYRDRGPYLARALSGLDTALWDLRGRAEGKGVCRLAGGRPRALPAYAATIHRRTSPGEEAARLKAACERDGFRAVKTRIGSPCGDCADAAPGRTEELIPLLRREMGDGVQLMADANSCYDADRAIAVGRMLEDNGYALYEEPCPYWDLESTARVASELRIPVGGGEQDWDPAQWRRMLEMGAVDVVQPDVCDGGGFSAALRVAGMAARSGRKVMPHSSDRSMCLVFTLHLMPALPNAGDFVEYSIEDEDWSDGLFDPRPVVEDGRLRVPEGPGWGVRIGERWLAGAERAEYAAGT
jgi:L-alanine-DL-glutamate epimerase-like enolase superfamily enzyme